MSSGDVPAGITSNLILSNLSSKQLFFSFVGAKELWRWVWCQLGIHPLHGKSLHDLQSLWHSSMARGQGCSTAPFLAGLENILCCLGLWVGLRQPRCCWQNQPPADPWTGNWRGAGAEL